MATLDGTGLTIENINTRITRKEKEYKAIYGNDINVDSNSPDGQRINNEAQSEQDIAELGLAVFNSFDPDQAVGIVLDQRVAFNNITRQAGTFTQQEVDITVDRNLNLTGLNDSESPFTVSDDNGVEFQLLNTVALSSGSSTLLFQASNIGIVETTPNTITNQVTIVLGVTAVNNPNAALETGINEETDPDLRTRRQRSPANNSQGFVDGLTATLFDLDNVSEVLVVENDTNVTDSNGIPAHSSWSIVEGGTDLDIANAILTKKSTGSGLKGVVEVEIILASSQIKTVKFDRPVSKNLHLRFDIQETIPGQSFDEDGIKEFIEDNKIYGISESAETASLTQVAQNAIDSTGGGGVPLNMELSDDGAVFVDFLNVDTLDEKWVISAPNIDITIL